MALWEREEALAELAGLHRQGGRIALVAGEAGIGKSSLVRAFAETRREPVWTGLCDPLVTPRPLGPWHDIARQAGGALREALAGRRPPLPALLDALERPGARPVLVIEDLHWADAATLDLLVSLARRIERVRALLVLTYRDDEAPDHPLHAALAAFPRDVLRRVSLPRLSEACVAAHAGRDWTAVYALTGGNPLLVTEALAGRQAGAVQHLILNRLASLPKNARDLAELAAVLQRLDVRGDGPESALVDRCVAAGVLVAAEGGAEFRHELLRRAVEDALPPGRRRALHLRAVRRLAARPGVDPARLAHHARFSEDPELRLSYSLMAAESAAHQGAHREAAAHYRDLVELGAGADVLEEYAFQAYLAGLADEALTARERAATLRRAAGDWERAGANERWISRVAWWSGDTALARRAVAAAVETLRAGPPGRELAMAYSTRAQLHMLAYEHEAAIEWGTRAAELAERLGDRETELHAAVNVATARLGLEETTAGPGHDAAAAGPDDATTGHDATARLGREETTAGLGHDDATAGRGRVDEMAGSGRDDAAAGRERVDEMADRGRDDAAAGRERVDEMADRERDDAAAGHGRDDATALRGHDAAAAGRRRVDATAGRGRDDAAAGRGRDDAAGGRGRVDAAAELVRVHERAAAAGYVDHAARALVNRAAMDLWLGDDVAATLTAIATAFAYADRHELDGYRQYLLGVRATVRVEAGDWDGALADADESLSYPSRGGVGPLPAYVARGRVQSGRGDPEAEETLDRALAVALATEELQRIGPVAIARAEHFLFAGDPDRAADEARRGLELAVAVGHRRYTRELAFRLWRAGGEPSAVDGPRGDPATGAARGRRAGDARRRPAAGGAIEDSAADARGRRAGDARKRPAMGGAIEHSAAGRRGVDEAAVDSVAGNARVRSTVDGAFGALMAGDWRAAADAWGRGGRRLTRVHALALGDATSAGEALAELEVLGARRAAAWVRADLRRRGVVGVPRGPRPATAANAAGLTGRQAEVLRLLADGRSNAEIAAALTLSEKTVQHHVSAILGKLSATSRTQAAATARRLGLV
ncbi:helix-turn-helix transcriptional regulator [Dactylosporangium sp. CS-033363]|uniref:helix-turn-helix transcriptional regulator n=1 Tax=Dactylosporangium sp. CS-033363 TaxID=3239935 RepID=UPI003D8FCF8A